MRRIIFCCLYAYNSITNICKVKGEVGWVKMKRVKLTVNGLDYEVVVDRRFDTA